MKLEIKSISVSSIVTSSFPVVIFILALLGSAVNFVMVPNPQTIAMSLWQKVMMVGLFSLLYMVIVSALLVFGAFLYNILTRVLGMKGISFDFEEVGDQE